MTYRPPLQSIRTYDLIATGTKSARVVALAPAQKLRRDRHLIVSRDEFENYFQAHAHAARTLADSIGLTDQLIPGATRDGFVFVIDCGVRA